MIMLLNTSTSEAELTFFEHGGFDKIYWSADRELSKGLNKFINEELKKRGKDLKHLSGLAVFQGPGSFTGLRIGMTVMNTLASTLNIPIVGETGDDWKRVAIRRLEDGENSFAVLPHYGSDAKITPPKK